MTTTKTAVSEQATKTRKNAKATARSARSTARSASTTARRQGSALRRDLVKQGKRVTGTVREELHLVRSTPTRPLMFAIGVADRTSGLAREVPSRLRGAPDYARQRVLATVSGAADLTERAQREVTAVASDGRSFVSSVRQQDSTQQAEHLIDRASGRVQHAVQDVQDGAQEGLHAVQDAAEKLG